jgi:hypothetical protein
LPQKCQKRIQAITSPPKEDCLLKIQRVQKSEIGIDSQSLFESWRNPRSFFDHDASVAVPKVYLELQRTHDPIRARIYAVALYALRLKVDKDIGQVIFNSSLVHDSLEDVSRWTNTFLKFGERMKAIADHNGGLGALVVIPSSLLTIRQRVTHPHV